MTETPKMWFKPKEKNDRTINIKCTYSQYYALEFAAKKLKMTKSDLIRWALAEYLAKHL